MIDLDELLAPLADGELGEPTPLEALAARVEVRARKNRRRRSIIGGSTAIAVLAVVGALTVLPGRQDGPVRVDAVGSDASLPGSEQGNNPDTSPPSSMVSALPVGNFPYDALANGGDLWVLNRTSNDVTRIDATTRTVRSTIALPPNSRGANSNRLAIHDGGVWVAGLSSSSGTAGAVGRIDIATETLTVIDTDLAPMSIASDGDRVWVAGLIPPSGDDQPLRQGIVAVSSDGVASDHLELPGGGFPVDVAASADRVWVLQQASGPSLLVEIDPDTGAVLGQLEIDAMAVRLVATRDELVVGTDTSGGGGRTGALTIVNPDSRTIVASAALDARPEAIIVLDDVIVTSGLRVLDRRTLQVRQRAGDTSGVGFALALVGSDLWATVTTNPDGSSEIRPVAIEDQTPTTPDDTATDVLLGADR